MSIKVKLVERSGTLYKHITQTEKSQARVKVLQEQIVQLERRYSDTLDNMLEGCQIIDFGWRYIYVNDAAARHGHGSRANMLGRTMMEVYPGIEKTTMFSCLQRCMQDRRPEKIENEFIFPDGSKGWFELNIESVPEGIMVLSQDITERKQKEERIIHLSNVLRAIRNVNQLITHEKDRMSLIQRSCDLLAERHGYEQSWIVLLNEQGTPVSVAGAGFNEETSVFIEQLKRRNTKCIKELLSGEEPFLALDRPGSRHKGCILTNIHNTQGVFRSKLEYEGKLYGILGVAGSSMDVSDKEEQELFLELCGDFAFALANIEREEHHQIAEAIIRENEEKYRSIFDEARDGIVLIDAETGEIAACNREFEKQTGRQFAQLFKMKIWELPVDEEKVIGNGIFREIRESGKTSFKEAHFLKPDNTIVPIECNARITYIQGKKYVQCITRDITERKNSEAENKFKAQLLDTSADSILVFDKTQTIIYANEAACDFHGCVREEIIGKNLKELIPFKDFNENIVTKLKEAEERGEVIFETVDYCLDNSTVPVEVHLRPIKPNGRQLYISIARDITERKQAEKALRENEERLREAQALGKIANYEIDLDTGSIIWSDEMYVLFGRDRQLLPPDFNEIRDYFSSGEFERYHRLSKDAVEKGIEVQDDFIARLPSGKTPVFSISVRPIKDEQGKVTTIFGIIQDITERKAAEEALRESKEHFHEMFEKHLAVMLLTDPESGNIIDANMAASEFYGYDRDVLRAMNINEINRLPSDVTYMARQTAATKRGNVFIFPHRIASGEVRTVEVHSSPIKVGSNTQLFSIIHDITDRKKSEEALKESEERLRAIVANAPIGIATSDLKKRFVNANDAFCKILGYSESDLQKMSFKDITHPQDMAESIAKLTDLDTGKISFFGQEKRYIKKDGTVITCKAMISAIRNSQGETFLYIAELEDITERKQAEEKIRQAYEKLQRTFHGITQAITATIEIRDPYTSGHQLKVAKLAKAIALEMGLSLERTDQIYTTGLIHDIGKLSVPAEILSRPGKLSEIEFSLIKMHPQIGYDILKNIDFPYPIARWVLEHHERLDGSGYPAGLTGEQISLEARILAVADVVESIASHRPYRPGLGQSASLDEIQKNSGILYSQEIVNACLTLFWQKSFSFE